MFKLLSLLVLALSPLGCASVSAPPDASPRIARISPEELARVLPKPAPSLPTAELVRMSKEGASAQHLIARIKESGSHYALSASQLIELHAQGVSAEVLDHIQAAQEQDQRDRIAEEINQREQRHAEELRREQEARRMDYTYDPWWPARPGYGWNYGHPYYRFGGYYWRR